MNCFRAFYTPEESDAGTFAYDPANRVREIDPYVNIPSETQTLTYTPFKKVKTIKEAGVTAAFTYWPDGERASMAINGGINPRTVYYAPDYEKIVSSNYRREYSYLKDEQGNIAAIVGKDDVSDVPLRYYVLTDYLGSITHVLNTNGSIVEEKSYDAWGRLRNPANWEPYNPTYSELAFYRGYTGHEYIPEFGIINMNGRLYDPLLGRMFSPDPYIMGGDNTQGYNRYSYALNNPLSYTDPSGEFLWVPIVIGAAVGAYLGGSAANNNFNLFQWNFSSANTWRGIAGGAITWALSGSGWSVGLGLLGQSGFWATAGKAILTGKIINTATTAASLIANFDNGMRVMAGRYYLDENRTFTGQLFQGVSRYTWEGLQTWMGYNYSQIRNTFSRDITVDYLGGATIINREKGTVGWWGVTMGNYINTQNVIGFHGGTPIGWENEGIQHEYGHTLQSRIFGLAYFMPIMPWSGLSTLFWLDTHDQEWFERGADRNWNTYFINHLQ